MDGSEVSFVVPTYQDADNLAELLASVAAQTVLPAEIVVADDGSTDHTAQVVADFAEAHPHLEVRYLESDVNTGIAAARNRAVGAATRPWLALSDSDDVSFPRRIERQLAAVDEWSSPRPLVAVIAWGVNVNARLAPVSPAHMGPVGEAAFDALRARGGLLFCLHSSVLVRREDAIAVGYRTEYDGVEDLDMMTRLIERGAVTCVPEELVGYRKRLGSTQAETTRRQDRALDRLAVNARRRHLGEPELSVEEHAAWRAAEPLHRRVARLARTEGKHHYRRGSVLAVNGQRVRGAGHLVVAGVLDPRRLWGGLRTAARGRLGHS